VRGVIDEIVGQASLPKITRQLTCCTDADSLELQGGNILCEHNMQSSTHEVARRLSRYPGVE
jgi:hypothetical protein